MKQWLLFVSAAALIACSGASEPVAVDAEVAAVEATPFYDIEGQYGKFAEVRMTPDTAFLSDSERAVVNKLMQVGPLLDEIFLL